MCVVLFFFFEQKTAYEVRISEWSSDMCSADLKGGWPGRGVQCTGRAAGGRVEKCGPPHLQLVRGQVDPRYGSGKPCFRRLAGGRSPCESRCCQAGAIATADGGRDRPGV